MIYKIKNEKHIPFLKITVRKNDKKKVTVSYPFQATLSLLERVLMKDVATPVPPEDVRTMIQTSLENAALLNYSQLSQKAHIEGSYNLYVFFCIIMSYKSIKYCSVVIMTRNVSGLVLSNSF